MKKNDRIESFAKRADVRVSPEVNEQVFQNICSQAAIAESNQKLSSKSIWSYLMHNRIVQATTAAAIGLAIIAFLTVPWSRESTLSAAEVLKKAAEKVPTQITTARIEGKIRSDPGDNFSGLSLDGEFFPTTLLWKKDKNGTKWRIDKGSEDRGRSVSSNGKKGIFYLWPSKDTGMAIQFPAFPKIGPCDTHWYASFTEPKKLLEKERDSAGKDGSVASARWNSEAELDGKNVFVVKVDHKASVSEKARIRNHFMPETDHTNIYFFDAETNDLLKIKIVAHAKGEDVVVFETTSIAYDQPIDDSEFDIKIPETIEVTSFEDMEGKILPNNAKYEAMSPKESATAFFTALHDKNWDEAKVFWYPMPFNDEFKETFGGLEIVEIGEPFQDELAIKHKTDQWMVPYRLRLPNGEEKKNALGLRKSPRAKRYIIGGGF